MVRHRLSQNLRGGGQGPEHGDIVRRHIPRRFPGAIEIYPVVGANPLHIHQVQNLLQRHRRHLLLGKDCPLVYQQGEALALIQAIGLPILRSQGNLDAAGGSVHCHQIAIPVQHKFLVRFPG